MSLNYKGYTAGPIEFDDRSGSFSGTVAGIRDLIHFAGRTAQEVREAFGDSVDDYLPWCAERGEPPGSRPSAIQDG